MIKKIFLISFIILLSSNGIAGGYDVYGLGIYDVKFNGSATKQATDLKFERRFDNSILDIGPESENFFYLKPFAGIEITSDSSYYLLGGIYLEDNVGLLFTGEKSNVILTPSFGVGYYDDGNGKKLGSDIEFRTTLELSYQLKNKNRIGVSFGHISNANIGEKNPGVEVLSFSYQVPIN